MIYGLVPTGRPKTFHTITSEASYMTYAVSPQAHIEQNGKQTNIIETVI